MRIHCKIVAIILCFGVLLLLYHFVRNAADEPPLKQVAKEKYVQTSSGLGNIVSVELAQKPRPVAQVSQKQPRLNRKSSKLPNRRGSNHANPRRLGEPKPPRKPVSEEWMHLAVVACGDRVDETLTMLKSALLFSIKKIKFHIFAEDSLKPQFEKGLNKWPHPFTLKFQYSIYSITFSVGNAQEWKKLFKPCAAQRLFLPVILKEVDSLLYVDTDVLFLRPMDDIWSFLKEFNTTQLAAMAPEHEIPKIGWYSRFARHPFYGKTGVNSGVMLMNLTRIRNTLFKNSMIPSGLAWEDLLHPLYQKYKNHITWGDQDLLNIIFHYNPDFEKEGKKEVCPVLDQFLCHVAKTGETMIQWSQFKSYFLFKLEKVMDDFRASAPEQRGPANPNVEYIPFEKMKERILKIVDGYNGIPFTIQRLCELLTDPKRNYAGTDKFLRGVEKNVMVVSCVYPTSEKNGSSSLNRMNGVMFPGNSPGYSDRINVNGPGTPRPMIRPKLSLSSPLTTNGLPDSTENKEPTVEQTEEKTHGESSTEEEGALGSPVKNKHLEEEDPMEAEGHEVKRLKFDKEEEEKETPQAAPSESSSEMPEEAETSSADQEGEKESSQCADQQGLQEEEPSSTQTKTPDGAASDEKVQSEVSAGTEDSTEESNQMDQSEEQTQPEKDLSTGARETSENTTPVSSTSEECNANEEPGTTSSAETPEIPSESAMENGTEATDTAEEPMEQD
ncbi:UNVERIFIED_CONTAM: hypothetical protein FKN15_023212 [Acipenser sinensis]